MGRDATARDRRRQLPRPEAGGADRARRRRATRRRRVRRCPRRAVTSRPISTRCSTCSTPTRARALAILINEAGHRVRRPPRRHQPASCASSRPRIEQATGVLGAAVAPTTRTLRDLVETTDRFVDDGHARARRPRRAWSTALGEATTEHRRPARASCARRSPRRPRRCARCAASSATCARRPVAARPGRARARAAARGRDADARRSSTPFRARRRAGAAQATDGRRRRSTRARRERDAGAARGRGRRGGAAQRSPRRAAARHRRARPQRSTTCSPSLENWSRAIQFRDGLSPRLPRRGVVPPDAINSVVDRLAPSPVRKRKPRRRHEARRAGEAAPAAADAAKPAAPPKPATSCPPSQLATTSAGIARRPGLKPCRTTLASRRLETVNDLLDYLLGDGSRSQPAGARPAAATRRRRCRRPLGGAARDRRARRARLAGAARLQRRARRATTAPIYVPTPAVGNLLSHDPVRIAGVRVGQVPRP